MKLEIKDAGFALDTTNGLDAVAVYDSVCNINLPFLRPALGSTE